MFIIKSVIFLLVVISLHFSSKKKERYRGATATQNLPIFNLSLAYFSSKLTRCKKINVGNTGSEAN